MVSQPSDTVHANRWKTLAVLALSLVIIGLDNTILNVALPTLQAELSASASTLQWMVDSYLLVFAGLLLVFGTLGDRLGRKLALQSGIAIFGIASLGSLIADTSGQVIVIRALMGVGAALIMPATLSIIANVFPAEERGKAIGIWAALAAVGIGLGPLTGGLLIEWFDWSAVFLVNVPVALIALVLGIRLVPESRDPRPGAFDFGGAALSTAGFTALVYAIIEAPGRGWTSATTLGLLAGAAGLLVAFVAWERHTAQPMLDLAFFRSARFSVGTAADQHRLLRAARGHLRPDAVPPVRARLLGDRGGRDHEPDGARPRHGRRLLEPGRRPARNRARGRGRARPASASSWRARRCGSRASAPVCCSAGSSCSPSRWAG